MTQTDKIRGYRKDVFDFIAFESSYNSSGGGGGGNGCLIAIVNYCVYAQLLKTDDKGLMIY
jgi:hypothetical protein